MIGTIIISYFCGRNNIFTDCINETICLDEESFFEIAEAVFVGWFTFEYVIRFIAAPRKLK